MTPDPKPVSRRAFVRRAALILAGAGLTYRLGGTEPVLDAKAAVPVLRFGILTDVHYADREPAGNRYYRESLTKMREAVREFNGARVSFAVELGDFIDAAETTEAEIGFLRTIDAEYAKLTGERHYVLGNHCVWTLTKRQFLENSGARKEYYSFDAGGFHFVVLDACYRKDGVAYGAKNNSWEDSDIPAAEQRWLAADLNATSRQTFVFVHQRIDATGPYAIKSAAAVRKILEDSGKVLAVFQGHHHRNEHQVINSIHYCTLAAMVEGTGPRTGAFAVVDLLADGMLKVNGFHNQAVYTLRPRPVGLP